MQARKLQVPAPDQRHQAAAGVRRKTDSHQQPGHAAAADAADRGSARQHRAAGRGADPAAGAGRLRGAFDV